MLENIKKSEIINDHKKVTGWIIGQIEHDPTLIEKVYCKPNQSEYDIKIHRIRSFGNSNPLELCRMVLSENYDLVSLVVRDMTPFIEAVLELAPLRLMTYVPEYGMEYDEPAAIKDYPKYIERLYDINAENEDERYPYFDKYEWMKYLTKDITIMDYAIKSGLVIDDYCSTILLRDGLEQGKIEVGSETYNIFSSLTKETHRFEIASYLDEFPDQELTIKCLFAIPEFSFKRHNEVTAFEDMNGVLYHSESECHRANTLINSYILEKHRKISHLTSAEQELILKYI